MVILICTGLVRNFYSAYLFGVHARIHASIFMEKWKSATHSGDGVRGNGLLRSIGAEGFLGGVTYRRVSRRWGGGGVCQGRQSLDYQGQRLGSMTKNIKKLEHGLVKGGTEGNCWQVSPWSDEDEESLRRISRLPVDGNVLPHPRPYHPTHHVRGKSWRYYCLYKGRSYTKGEVISALLYFFPKVQKRVQDQTSKGRN